MEFTLYLEVNTGDILQIIRPDGRLAGRGLIDFQTAYSSYDNLHKTVTEEFIWFQKFESIARLNLRKFWSTIYIGNWDFGEEEYERFKICVQDNPFNDENEYREAIRSINNLWTPIDQFIEIVEEILQTLPQMGDETYWYHKNETMLEFHGLLDTLLLAKKRYGKEARLKGE